MPMGPRPPLSRTILKRERPDNVKSCPATLSAVPPRCPREDLSPYPVNRWSPICARKPGSVKTCPRSPVPVPLSRIGEDLSPVVPDPPVPNLSVFDRPAAVP